MADETVMPPASPLASPVLDDSLWVFAYGSLMWRPGFEHLATVPAKLTGFHRSLCVYSHVHRGTPERPGLVLGLDRGGSCHGLAFAVAREAAEATIAYLREREQVTGVYLERMLPLSLADGRKVRGLGYVVDRRHVQYAGRLEEERLLAMVREAEGQSGRNPDYVISTWKALAGLGVRDPVLDRLARALDAG